MQPMRSFFFQSAETIAASDWPGSTKLDSRVQQKVRIVFKVATIGTTEKKITPKS